MHHARRLTSLWILRLCSPTLSVTVGLHCTTAHAPITMESEKVQIFSHENNFFFFLTYPQFKSKPFSSCAYVGQFLLFGILDTWSQIETTFSDKHQKTWHPSENFLTDEKHHIRHEWTFQCPRPPIGQWDEVLTQLVCGTRCEAFHWYRFSVTWAHAFTPFPAASSMLVNNRLPTENKHNSDDR